MCLKFAKRKDLCAAFLSQNNDDDVDVDDDDDDDNYSQH